MDELSLSQIQDQLQQIIQDVTGGPLTTIPDDIPILDLGVSSLELVEGMRRVYDRFGVLVSIRRVIEGQVTLGGLALYIDQELGARQVQKKNGAAARSGGAQATSRREIPLAPAQQHVAFLSRYSDEASAAFNLALAVRLSGPLDGPALQAALERAGAWYEALRTTLHPDHDSLLISSSEAVELLAHRVAPRQLEQRLAEIAARPFRAGSRLFQAELLRLSEEEHLLVLVGHALVLDQQALWLLLEEIARLYRAFAHDQDVQSPLAPLQWSDYLALGAAPEASPARQQAADYWQGRFAGGAPQLELPYDRPRPPVKRYAGARLALDLDPQLRQRLQEWAQQAGLSPETVLLAGYAISLHRLSGQNQLVIGVESLPIYGDTGLRTVAAARSRLPVWSEYSPRRSFEDQVQALSAALEEAQAHRQLSLAEMIQLLDLPRDQSRSPLFTAAFRSLDAALPQFDGLQARLAPCPAPGSPYDLELSVRFEPDGIQLICDYSTELFEAGTLQRWLDGLLALLDAGLAAPQQACGLLPVMTAAERRLIEVEWNATRREYPRHLTALHLILEQTRLRPEATAVRFQDASLSYRRLAERTAEIASLLAAHGVRPGERVGILLERSLDLVPALLAAWRLGACYVPMDFHFPQARLAMMLADARLRVALTGREFRPLAEAHGAAAIVLDEAGPGDPGRVDALPLPAGEQSAVILFTSGSTGRPKGVEVRHAALLNFLLAAREALEFGPESRMLALTTISFDIAENEIFMPLIAGGCVDLAEDGLATDGLALAARLASRPPSHLQATPSSFKVLLAGGWAGLPELRLLSAGEALSRDLAEQLLPKCAVLWNQYGPTETTVYSSIARVTSMPGQPVSIGRPLPNQEFFILDALLQPVPLGAVGELYIGGEGLAAGYWQRPDLTAERFLPHPFHAAQRMYRTGDLARYLPDGSVICLGRIDDQVKIHGVRIELAEVELALRQLAGVRDAAAVPWRDAHGDLQLVAHIIPEQPGEISAAALRAQLRQRLPESMIPVHFLFTQAFPLTANRKLQRSALPAPEAAAAADAPAAQDPPATPTEIALASAWAQVLAIAPTGIGRDSDFMELGGHSLLMTQLMVVVREKFQVSFNLGEFFKAPTIRRFALLIDERQRQQTGGSRAGSRSNGRHSAVSAASATVSAASATEYARQRMAFLQREAQLPLYIAPARGLSFRPAPLQRVLLTGATGFIGAYLVAEILKTTPAELYCLVRPRRGEDSKRRIERTMQRYAVWNTSDAWRQIWDRRVHVLDGDVTLPRLGIADAQYERLAEQVDAIIHGAAHVNFIYPYEALRAANVLGLHEIIQFAFYRRIKPVHHLSTAAIWPMGAQHTFYEKDAIDHKGLLNLGYDEAKWVGEKCLLNAAERGLPVVRYRPGEVGGDSQTGRCVTDHFLVATVKGFLQFGAFPQLDIQVDVAPVDYIARAIVYLAFQRQPYGRAFHLTNPQRISMRAALDFLRSCGYQFDELPFEELRDRLVSSRDFAANALFAYQAALEEMDNVSMQLPTYDTRETRRELQGSGISCAPADEQLFGTYLRYLQSTGFIPAPEALPTHA